MPTAFISYSRKDTEFVRRLYSALGEQGLAGWVDWEGIPPADDWMRKVHAAIEGADAFVFVMTPESLCSTVCADEVAHAVRHNKRLIPAVVREVNRVDHPAIEIPEPLRRLNWIFFRESDDFDNGVGKLVAAIRTDLEWVESHTRLLSRALEWQTARRDDSFLLQGTDLVAAEQWLACAPDKDPKPTALQSDYIIASRASATRRQRRYTAAAIAAVVLVSIGAIVATVQYVIAEVRRQDALSRQLAAQSAAEMDDSPELGLLLGVYAHNVAPTLEASNALLSALNRTRGVQAFLPGQYLAGTLALSADGSLMAVGRCTAENELWCKTSVIDLWRVAEPKRIDSVAVPLGVRRLAFSEDAKRLGATICCEGESDSNRGRALLFDLAGDGSAEGALKLRQVAARAIDQWRGAVAAEQVADARAVGDAREALERVRRATGRGEKAFATPAAFRAGTRVLVHVVEGELGDPIQVELWDSASSPRRLASVVLRSPVWGEHAIRADGRLAASFGCRLAASGRICSEGQLVVLDDTDKKPRVAAVGYDLDDWIRSIAVMPHEPLVLSGGCGKYDYQNCLYGELRAWQAESDGEKPRGYEPVRTFGGALESIALSADGKAMGLTSQRGKVALMRLDAARGEAAWLASPLEAKFERLRADPQPALKCGKQVVSNPILARASAQLQAPDALCAALEVFPPSPDRTALDQRVLPAASASGTRLALNGCATWKGGANVCEGERTTVWSIVDQRLAHLTAVDTPNTVTALAFAPDGTHLALATCSETRAADCEDGKLELIALDQEGYPRRTLVERAGVITAIAFRPGFDALAYSTCARLEDTGAVRDCALGAIRRLGFGPAAGGDATLTAHRGTMSVLAYSADGTLLVSGGTDGSVALWDAKQGERLGPVVPAHSQPVAAIRFESADAFVSSTEHDEIEWHASPGRWKSVACRIANRRLTAAEHMRFLGPRETVRDPCESAASTQGSAFLRWARGLIGSER